MKDYKINMTAFKVLEKINLQFVQIKYVNY